MAGVPQVTISSGMPIRIVFLHSEDYDILELEPEMLNKARRQNIKNPTILHLSNPSLNNSDPRSMKSPPWRHEEKGKMAPVYLSLEK